MDVPLILISFMPKQIGTHDIELRVVRPSLFAVLRMEELIETHIPSSFNKFSEILQIGRLKYDGKV